MRASRGWGTRLLVAAAGLLAGCGQGDSWRASIAGEARPAQEVAASDARGRAAASAIGVEAAPAGATILFGDLHVHTSYSWDGWLMSLPLFGGEGGHPPADACDFARHCSALDFYAITEHAESLLPEHWSRVKDSVRQCNARAGDAGAPDLVAFTGFEWTQAGETPEEHYGHRCVIFPETDDAGLPLRPIAAANRARGYLAMSEMFRRVRWSQPAHFGEYQVTVQHLEALAALPGCREDVPSSELDAACLEIAHTPAELHRKLDEQGLEALDIPHGTSWGVYTPATTSIDKHLEARHFDPRRQRAIEVMSGHGSSEEYRAWRHVETTAGGERVCPEPSADFLPCCWQAGEIMRSRCGDLPDDECERRVELARRYAAGAQVNPTAVFPDAPAGAWLDCGQCRDCFKPTFTQRPLETVQYAMALSNFDEPGPDGSPLRFEYGFIGSSDIHDARAGVGYKQHDVSLVTDGGAWPEALTRAAGDAVAGVDPQMPQRPGSAPTGLTGNDPRTRDFLYSSGLAAVHARGRTREAIWDALQRREVYGTSGPRILLWFDLLSEDGSRLPMGSQRVLADGIPRLEVRAVGSLEQRPGCPESATAALGTERLDWLCRGECYHPGERRRRIERIEVVRIRRQRHAGEPVDALIDDPWRSVECPPDPAGCVAELEDPEFATDDHDVLYYARVLEEPSMAVQGRPLAPERDAAGNVVDITLCGDPALGPDCLGEVRERAWSSPIFVSRAR